MYYFDDEHVALLRETFFIVFQAITERIYHPTLYLILPLPSPTHSPYQPSPTPPQRQYSQDVAGTPNSLDDPQYQVQSS